MYIYLYINEFCSNLLCPDSHVQSFLLYKSHISIVSYFM